MRWLGIARPNQIAPTWLPDWKVWMIKAGRGFGKNRCASEAVWWHLYQNPGTICGAISPTGNDLIRYVFEGISGYCAVIPPEILKGGSVDKAYVKSPYPHIEFANGSRIEGYTAEKPDRVRGANLGLAHCDEIASWIRDRATWDNLQLALRIGADPKIIVTSTPRPKTLVRDIANSIRTILSNGSTYDNKANLSPSFLAEVERLYEGTKIGRQELHGEIIDPEEAGVIKRSWIKQWPAAKADGNANPFPRFEFIVISLDTAYSEKDLDDETNDPDPTACQVWGAFYVPGEKPKDLFGKRVYPPMNVLLLDSWQDWLGFPDLVKRTLKAKDQPYGAAEDAFIAPLIGPDYRVGTGRKADLIIVEDKGSGISLRQTLAGSGIGAYAYNPGNADKLARLHMVSHMFSNGLVWVPEGALVNSATGDFLRGTKKFAKWSDDAVEQWCTFAGEGSIDHDDFVDAMSAALRVMSNSGILQPTKLPDSDPVEGTYARPPSERANPYAA